MRNFAINWLLGSILLSLAACKANNFSSRDEKGQVATPPVTEDQIPAPIEQPPLKLDSTAICKALFGIPESEECRLAGNNIFGGSYQNGAVSIPNPRTSAESCPDGFNANLMMTLSVPNRAIGIDNDQYTDSSVYICLVDQNTVPPESQDPTCPEGQSKILFGEKLECSDVTKRVCEALDGTFDGAGARCTILAQETVFGGYFVSGNNDMNLGQVTVVDQDNNDLPITEFCEHPNVYSAQGDCSCPAQFDPYTSSAMAEYGATPEQVGTDRPTYCIGKELSESITASDAKPLDNCSQPWERAYIVGAERVCSAVVHDICVAFGGAVDSSSEKCVYAKDSFFGGSFQIGFSGHQMTDGVAWPMLPEALRDPTIASANQYCEAPNPESDQEKELSCSCPPGFNRHALAFHHEAPDPIGDYDKEFICVRN